MQKTGFILLNLVPYREQQKKIKIQQLLVLMGISVFTAITINFMYIEYIQNKIEMQVARNTILTEENIKLRDNIEELDSLKDKIAETLEKRLIVESLQTNRSDFVKVINTISKYLPEGTVITSINKIGDKINVQGETQSNSKIASYMLDLEKTNVFEKPELLEIKSNEKKKTKNIENLEENISFFSFNLNLERDKKLTEILNKKLKNKK